MKSDPEVTPAPAIQQATEALTTGKRRVCISIIHYFAHLALHASSFLSAVLCLIQQRKGSLTQGRLSDPHLRGGCLTHTAHMMETKAAGSPPWWCFFEKAIWFLLLTSLKHLWLLIVPRSDSSAFL